MSLPVVMSLPVPDGQHETCNEVSSDRGRERSPKVSVTFTINQLCVRCKFTLEIKTNKKHNYLMYNLLFLMNYILFIKYNNLEVYRPITLEVYRPITFDFGVTQRRHDLFTLTAMLLDNYPLTV